MKKIQLWSDKGGKEYAVCIPSERGAFRASTNSSGQYVMMVEEADYIEGEKYDWAYMLGRWIDSRSGNWIGTTLPNIEGRALQADAMQRGAKKKKAQVATLKCHFCGLTYAREKERASHEKTWHVAKINRARYSP